MYHRGPDDEGIYTARQVGLGHRRLSIIDLNTGKQPISNEDNSIWVVFNGEIYNYQELKKNLMEKDHLFRTETDTEVIVFQSPPDNAFVVSVDTKEVAFMDGKIRSEDVVCLPLDNVFQMKHSG